MKLLYCCIAEVIGTFLLVLIGTASIAWAMFTDAQVALWQIAAIWGLGVTVAIYAASSVSGAHINPAVSLAFAIYRRRDFPLSRLLAYWASQLSGGVLAGLVVLGVFGPSITRFETVNYLSRGAHGSQLSAMAFGEYFPNPSILGTGAEARALISPLGAAVSEALGVAILVFVVFALVDRRTISLPVKYLTPVFIGVTLAVLIVILAPLTQAGLNPARDFGPRLVAFFAGWDSIAIPGPSSGFWAYIVGPLIGGPAGAGVYERLVRRGRRARITMDSEDACVMSAEAPLASDA